MFSCPFLPCKLSLSVIPHVPGHLSVQYAVLRTPQLEVSKGITLSQEPFLSSVGNSQSLEQEISYSISKAPSFYLSEVPTVGCELCPFLRAEEEGYVSFLVPGPGPQSPHSRRFSSGTPDIGHLLGDSVPQNLSLLVACFA